MLALLPDCAVVIKGLPETTPIDVSHDLVQRLPAHACMATLSMPPRTTCIAGAAKMSMMLSRQMCAYAAAAAQAPLFTMQYLCRLHVSQRLAVF